MADSRKSTEWWMSVSENKGCMLMLIGRGETDKVPRSLQREFQAIIERITKTKDFRWTTEDKVMKMF